MRRPFLDMRTPARKTLAAIAVFLMASAVCAQNSEQPAYLNPFIVGRAASRGSGAPHDRGRKGHAVDQPVSSHPEIECAGLQLVERGAARSGEQWNPGVSRTGWLSRHV